MWRLCRLGGAPNKQDFRGRVRGTLHGVAVGDALGASLDGLSVEAYVDRWGVDEAPAHGKTVWADLAPGRREP